MTSFSSVEELQAHLRETFVDATLGAQNMWLPRGLHNNIHIKLHSIPLTGPMTGGGHKIVWHTTESGVTLLDRMEGLLVDEGFEPHLLFGREPRQKDYTIVQFLPFNMFSKALEHPSGTPATNTANAIQIEVCGFARDSSGVGDGELKALANVVEFIEHRVPVPRHVGHHFLGEGHATRYSAQAWINFAGHAGHEHAPNQHMGHWDPGALNVHKLLGFCS